MKLPTPEEGVEIIRSLSERAATHWRLHANRRTVTVLIALMAPFIALYLTALRPPVDFPTHDIVTIERDMPLAAIAATLEREQVVRSGPALEIIVRLMGAQRSLHAGDYLFRTPKNSWRVARALIIGDYGVEPVRIRIPAGSTISDMADIFAKHMIRFDRDTFIELALPFEGYLYPDTYFFLPIARESILVDTLRQTFDAKLDSLRPDIEKFGKPLPDIVTMASLIEREESDYEDKRTIAGILWKRLEIGMPLQVDATFVYIIGKGSNQLTIEDLQYDSPYNTYLNKGLPPGPISAPSTDSIRATINPNGQGYLFYLADRHGTTYYSKKYEEHLRKKRHYLGS